MRAFVEDLMRRFGHVNAALLDQMVVSGGNFATGVLLAHALGVSEFGRFTLAWLVVLFVQSIQNGAIIAPMMSLGPTRSEDTRAAYYGAVFTHQLVFAALSGGLALVLIIAAATLFPSGEIGGFVAPLTGALVLNQLQNFLRRYHFTAHAPVVSLAGDVLRYGSQTLCLFALIALSPDRISTTGALWILTASAAASTAVLYLFVKRIDWSGRALKATTQEHWTFGKWLTGAELLDWFAGNIFIIFIGAFLSTSAAGAFRAAKSLIGLLHILFHAMENFVPVRAAELLQSRGFEPTLAYFRQVTLFGGGATAIVGFVFAIAPDFWLGTVFGAEFIGYGQTLKWLALAYLFIFMDILAQLVLRALGATWTIFAAYAGAAALTTAIAYPFVHYLGLDGAVFGYVLVPLVKSIVMGSAIAWQIHQRRKHRPAQ